LFCKFKKCGSKTYYPARYKNLIFIKVMIQIEDIVKQVVKGLSNWKGIKSIKKSYEEYGNK